jgi:hypothetical protein
MPGEPAPKMAALHVRSKQRFNGFHALSKTAEAVGTHPPHFHTPLKRGVNEKRLLRMLMLMKHSG